MGITQDREPFFTSLLKTQGVREGGEGEGRRGKERKGCFGDIVKSETGSRSPDFPRYKTA